MSNSNSPTRAHKVGALALALGLGLGTMVAAGLSSPAAHADTTAANTSPARSTEGLAGSPVVSMVSNTTTSGTLRWAEAPSALPPTTPDKALTTTGAISEHFSGASGSALSPIWSKTIGTGWDRGIQNYTRDGAYLDGQGHLVLQATKTSTGGWTSGRVETVDKLTMGYGTLAAEIKVPKGQGLWPAFWLTGTGAAWPHAGEVDIMELPSTTTTMHSTLHGPIAGSTKTQQAQLTAYLTDLSADYHKYWVTRLHNKITFGVDDLTLGTLTPNDLAPEETWVYNRPMYVTLNLAVGGPWAGAPDHSTPTTAKMLVDSMTFTPA